MSGLLVPSLLSSLVARLKAFAARIKQELAFYQRLLSHPQTPGVAKVLLWCAVGYLLLPFDLIPDFIPVLGQLDDLVIVPLLIVLAMRLTPDVVVAACREKQNN